MIVMKFGRHEKGKFQVSKKARALISDHGRFFANLDEPHLFRYYHTRTTRTDFTASGYWGNFLKFINAVNPWSICGPAHQARVPDDRSPKWTRRSHGGEGCLLRTR